MAASQTWKLKRYGRFVPGTKQEKPWKVFEANGNKPNILLTIVESGYLLIMQGQESLGINVFLRSSCLLLKIWIVVTSQTSPNKVLAFILTESSSKAVSTGGSASASVPVTSNTIAILASVYNKDTIPLLCGSDFLKVRQKSDNLMFRSTVKGESRLMRMQFDGSSREEAIKKCSSAVEKLMGYISVTIQEDAPVPPNPTPAEVSAPAQTLQGKSAGVEPEVVQGPLSLKRLAQHMLGETVVTLPQVNQHGSLAQGDLEPFLRICLLDPSFPAFVDEVEGELRKLLQE